LTIGVSCTNIWLNLTTNKENNMKMYEFNSEITEERPLSFLLETPAGETMRGSVAPKYVYDMYYILNNVMGIKTLKVYNRHGFLLKSFD
jgi:hypothetical protein